MNKFNFDKIRHLKLALYDAIYYSKDPNNIMTYNHCYELFKSALYEELQNVTYLKYEHESQIIFFLQDVLDLLTKGTKRAIKKQIRLHFRN